MHNKHKSDYNPDYISPWMTNHEEQRHLSKSFATHWSGNLPVNPHPKTSLYKIKPKHKAQLSLFTTFSNQYSSEAQQTKNSSQIKNIFARRDYRHYKKANIVDLNFMFGHKVDSKIYPQCSQSNGSRLGNSLTLKNKKNRCQGSISKTTEIQLRKVDSIESDSLKLVDRKLSAFSTTLRKYIVTRNRKQSELLSALTLNRTQ